MKKSLVVLSLLGSLLCANELIHKHTHWGYTGHEAPKYWGDLDPKFEACKKGLNQSPINISKDVTVEAKSLEPIEFDYHADSTEVVNNGHAIQVNVDEHSSINVDGKHFVLKQFHFHSPSENEINGKSFPLEAHFVHVADDGTIAVVGVLYVLGDKNPTLEKIWTKMPPHAGVKEKLALLSEDIEKLLPKDRDYYRFNGSLTTPPCTEGVRWMVFKKYVTISKDQVKKFVDTMGVKNNRPTQPINARKVLK
jgi:carbonic anhydrase